MDRRELLKMGLGVGVLAIGGRFLTACHPPSFGPLNPADANGLMLPNGFTSRVIATTGVAVAGTSYVWHTAPDGGACFPTDDGGWIYVSNSEWVPALGAGASMVRFDSSGTIVDARRILGGTTLNCAGGPTPWGTWLSGEEFDTGRIWECDPTGVNAAVARSAMGSFKHEAAAVDPLGKAVYLTEDVPDGGLYRFVPTSYPDLSAGTLQILCESAGTLSWGTVPTPTGWTTPPRNQVPNAKRFNGGEGIWFHDNAIFFTTKGDNRIWRYLPLLNELRVHYDFATSATPSLSGVDNITSNDHGDLFVAEDGGDMQIVQYSADVAAPVVQLTGVSGSEITGPAFNPDGTRLYFSSQRNPGRTYEVTGPWER